MTRIALRANAACFAAIVSLLFGEISNAATSRVRQLIVFSKNSGDGKLKKQLAIAQEDLDGWKERNIVVRKETGTSKEAVRLRRKYGVKADFQTLLIGKDGHIAMVEDEPVTSAKLFEVIDAMPMRKDEVRSQGATTHRY